ncbi:MAG: hypothetical protein HONBIEJF_00547 [Fimbriimonadaceae bacterium]|nr:hypothetical protein [Fimbriimonadaceae bacterium]
MCLFVSLSPTVWADELVVTPLQVGGFFDGGFADNKIEHQNYFVGYGTVGGVRTSERRSFFWYHIPDFEGEVIDVHIKLKMAASTSLIFGLDPFDETKKDPTETFQLGATFTPGLEMVRSDLTTDEAQTIFDGMNDFAVADPYVFSMSEEYEFPFTTEIHMNAFGKSIISSIRGGDVTITGWMPTWSHDERLDGEGDYLEGDELLYGLSDIPGIVPPPELTIRYEPVPEPITALALLMGVGLMARRRR